MTDDAMIDEAVAAAYQNILAQDNGEWVGSLDDGMVVLDGKFDLKAVSGSVIRAAAPHLMAEGKVQMVMSLINQFAQAARSGNRKEMEVLFRVIGDLDRLFPEIKAEIDRRYPPDRPTDAGKEESE